MKKITKSHPWSSRLASWIIALSCFALMSTTAYAQPANDNCGGAIALDIDSVEGKITHCLGCADTYSTEGATSVLDIDPTCWGTAPSSTVWFKVTIVNTGVYTFSTDNGINQFGEDMQMALFRRGAADCVFDATFGTAGYICNEDMPNPDNSNDFAAVITDTLTAGTYYIMVDQFGAATGKFCISVTLHDEAAPKHDLIGGAISITGMLSGLSSTTPFKSENYFYNAPDNGIVNDAPTIGIMTTGGGTTANAGNNDCNGNGATAVYDTLYDVWHSFAIPVGGVDAWLEIAPQNGGNFYGLQIYVDPGAPYSTTLSGGIEYVDGLTLEGCSSGDRPAFTQGTAGEDAARGNNGFNAMYNLGSLGAGNYLARIFQVTRVNGGDGSAASPSEGVYTVIVQGRGVGAHTYSSDGFSADSCQDAKAIGCSGTAVNQGGLITKNGLNNSGTNGNVYLNSPTGSGNTQTTPDGVEPLAVSGTPNSGSYQQNCTGTNLIPVDFVDDVNTSVFYKFTINDSLEAKCTPNAVIIQTIIDLLDDLCEEQVVILPNGPTPGPIPVIDDATCAIIEGIVNTLLVGVVDGVVIEQVRLLIDDLTTPPLPSPVQEVLLTVRALLDNACLPAFPCLSQVQLKVTPLSRAGVNGGRLYVNVYEELCENAASANAVMFGIAEACDESVCLRPGGGTLGEGFLANGDYYIMVTGERGTVAKYNLELEISHTDSTGAIACGTDNCATLKTASIKPKFKTESGGLTINRVSPVPATQNIDVMFDVAYSGRMNVQVFDITGKMVYNKEMPATTGSNTRNIPVDELKGGVYIIRLEKGGEYAQTRFIKVD